MCGWTDDGSGISLVRYVVHLMNTDMNDQLADTGAPVVTYNDTNFLNINNNFRYTLRASGVYSIKMTVYDAAGNYATARKLLVYTGDSKMTSS